MAEPLPVLNEGDETVTLADLLATKDECLSEEELWALCRECCLILELVNTSQDVFQTMCITPETLAFDQSGNVCFLDLDVDPEPLYVPPEYEKVGNSIKSHLFSLGMSMSYAAQYNLATLRTKPNLSAELNELINVLTFEDHSARPDLDKVISLCDAALRDKSSQDICINLASIVDFLPPTEESECSSIAGITADLSEYLNSQSMIIGSRRNTSLSSHHYTASPNSEALALDDYQREFKKSHNYPISNSTKVQANQPGSDQHTESRNSNNGYSRPKDEINPKLSSEYVKSSTVYKNFMSSTKTSEADHEPPVFHSTAIRTNSRGLTDSSVNGSSQSGNGLLSDNDSMLPSKDIQLQNKRGLPISEILKSMDRYFEETELWALCREGALTLQRRRKHPPAYISPDTLLIRQDGTVSYKSIPEDKPLEVVFMAPELQKKRILNEKTCVYGLGVTIRSAAGRKYSSSLALPVSKEFERLLLTMLQNNPDKRPSAMEIVQICNRHENLEETSLDICHNIYEDSSLQLSLQMSRRQSGMTAHSSICNTQGTDGQVGTCNKNKDAARLEYSTESDMNGDFEPTKREPSHVSAFKPIHTSAFTSIKGNTALFKPIPIKPEVSNDKCLSAFTKVPIKTEEPNINHLNEASKFDVTVNSQEKLLEMLDCEPNDNDKDVVRKLKQLKKNLMIKTKKYSSSTNKIDELENIKQLSSRTDSSLCSSVFSDFCSDERREFHNKSSEKSRTPSNSGALESLLGELQKSGNIPDTDALAAAIAQHLHSHLSSGEQSKKDAVVFDNTNIPPVQTEPPKPQTNKMASLSKGEQSTSRLPDLNIPQQYHSQLVGQTVTLPMQYGTGGVFPSFPMQVHLQHDPQSGSIQLVPMNYMPVSQQASHQEQTSTLPQHNCDTESNYDNMSKIQNKYKNINEELSDGGKTHCDKYSRTTKQIIHERSVNNKSAPISNLKRNNSENNLYHAFSDSEQNQSHLMSRQHNIHDDGSLPQNNRWHHDVNRMDFMTRARQAQQRVDNHSQSSSPSPSKDSGVSGMNIAYAGQGTLMDRLLSASAETLKQHKKMGGVLHLLREEFTFDGYMENCTEDLAMAEYISSLGNLKWETFASAITEKYCDLFWSVDVLANLFEIVNGSRPKVGGSKSQTVTPVHMGTANRVSQNITDDSALQSHTDSGNISLNVNQSTNVCSSSQQPQTMNMPKCQAEILQKEIQDIRNGFVETSDSTDTERCEKRRRYRKKHELDRVKSSSLNNLLLDSKSSINYETKHKFPSEKLNTSHERESVSDSEMNVEKRKKCKESFTDSDMPADSTSLLGKQRNSTQIQDIELSSTQTTTATQNSNGTLEDPHYENTSSDVFEKEFNSNEVFVPIAEASDSSDVSTSGRIDTSSLELSSSLSPRESSLFMSPRLTRAGSFSSYNSLKSSTQSQHEYASIMDYSFVKQAVRKGHVVYHWAMMQLNLTPQLEKFMHSIDEENQRVLETKIAEIDQEVMMEKRSKKKTQKLFKQLLELNAKASKGESKAKSNQLSQVSKDLNEMTDNLHYLELKKNHLEMLMIELNGIDLSYLYSLAVYTEGEAFQLKPKFDNQLLQFHIIREPQIGCEIQALHAGTPEGLLSYLFARSALSDGFVHNFLYCFRYFITPLDLFQFVTNIFLAANSCTKIDNNICKVKQRSLDILQFWIEDYHSLDIEKDEKLATDLDNFISNKVCDGTEVGQTLLSILQDSQAGNHIDMSYSEHFNPPEEEQIYTGTGKLKKPRLAPDNAKQWDTFKMLLKGKKNDRAKTCRPSVMCASKKNDTIMEVYFPKTTRRTDAFTLSDYTSSTLAEQLTLIDQDFFQQVHPVHFLNSKYQGISVDMLVPGSKTPAMVRRNQLVEEYSGTLFATRVAKDEDSIINQMILHNQMLSHWVVAEIVGSSTTKSQVAVLTKFLHTAQICMEIRNFWSCLGILDGLENLIVRQLPAWKSLQTKGVTIMEELRSTKMFLKTDALSLMQEKNCHLYPTIPPILVFLLHVQQIEVGGFKLANGMVKWSKLRSISQVVDQIRIFKTRVYTFEPDYDLQDMLQQRMREFSSMDLHAIAAEQNQNFPKVTSGGIGAAFKRVRSKFSKADR